MPYLLLIIGLLIGLYALYRFFLNAEIHQIKALFLSAVLMTLCVALFYMALTGRLIGALGLLAALVPIAAGIRRSLGAGGNASSGKDITTREEALEILGLEDSASDKEIKAAYTALMKKVHPDHEGSEWMATKLNQAKAILLQKNEDA